MPTDTAAPIASPIWAKLCWLDCAALTASAIICVRSALLTSTRSSGPASGNSAGYASTSGASGGGVSGVSTGFFAMIRCFLPQERRGPRGYFGLPCPYASRRDCRPECVDDAVTLRVDARCPSTRHESADAQDPHRPLAGGYPPTTTPLRRAYAGDDSPHERPLRALVGDPHPRTAEPVWEGLEPPRPSAG